jgi:hypothetical protein
MKVVKEEETLKPISECLNDGSDIVSEKDGIYYVKISTDS